MSKEVRSVFLSKILSQDGVNHFKYSSSYTYLKAVIELERKDSKDKLPKRFFEKFSEISDNLNYIDERVKGIPVLVLEQYFVRNSRNLDQYIFISYNDIDVSDLKVVDLYQMLESFFMEIYMLAVEIADYYAIEPKLKRTDMDVGEEVL